MSSDLIAAVAAARRARDAERAAHAADPPEERVAKANRETHDTIGLYLTDTHRDEVPPDVYTERRLSALACENYRLTVAAVQRERVERLERLEAAYVAAAVALADSVGGVA